MPPRRRQTRRSEVVSRPSDEAAGFPAGASRELAFALEEYRQKWEYVRHIEKLRHQFITGLLVLTTALLGFVFRDADSIFDVRNASDMALLLFAVAIFVFGQLFVLSQKIGYHQYVKRIRTLDGSGVDAVPTKFITFRAQYGVIATLGSGLCALAVIAIPWRVETMVAGAIGGAIYAGFSLIAIVIAERSSRASQ